MVAEATLGLDLRNASDADKPLIIAKNALRDNNNEAIWNTAGTTAGGDVTDPDFPTSNAYNGQLHFGTKPTDQTSDTYYLVCDLNNQTVDCLMIKYLSTILTGLNILVEVADNGTFTTNLLPIHSSTITADTRIVDVSLGSGDAKIYTTTQFLRVKLNATSDFPTASVPHLGEVFIGQRRQISRKLNIPFDDRPVGSESSDFVAKSRARHRYVYARGFRDIGGTWTPTGVAGVSGGDGFNLNDTDTIRGIVSDSQDATSPVVYIEDPNTDPTQALMGHINDNLAMPLQGPFERAYKFDLTEIPPFRNSET